MKEFQTELIFDTYIDAMCITGNLINRCKQDGYVTCEYLFMLINGRDSKIDENKIKVYKEYGWINLESIPIEPYGNGGLWIIELENPIYIKDFIEKERK